MTEPLPVSPREGYRLWAATFDSHPSAVIALETRTLEPLLPGVLGRRVVDVGCGTGRWTRWARKRGARVAGFDLSPEMLARAAAKPGLRGRLALSQADALPVPDRCADCVVCALTLGHLPVPHAALCELARIARPGAAVLLSDFHPDAVSRGWKRTFRNETGLREIETHPYHVAALLDAASRAGLRAECVLEPAFDEPEREIFTRAGREDLYREVRGVPAVLVVRWRKLP